MRSTRDLIRRRLHLVRKRGQLLAHIQNTRAQYDLPEFGRKLAYKTNRDRVVEHFVDPSVQKSIEVDVALIDQYDAVVTDLDLTIVREAAFPADPRPPLLGCRMVGLRSEACCLRNLQSSWPSNVRERKSSTTSTGAERSNAAPQRGSTRWVFTLSI